MTNLTWAVTKAYVNVKIVDKKSKLVLQANLMP